MDDARRVLREAAAPTPPLTLQLGPPTTFLPANPTLYLSASGPGAQALQDLRDRVFVPPLERPLTWAFVPHVTIADEMDPARVAASVDALAGYRRTVTFDRVHLLEESKTDAGRVWHPIADASFAAPAIVGRGGIELELTVSERPDEEAAAFSAHAWERYWVDVGGPEDVDHEEPFTIVARRNGDIVGVAEGWTHGGVAYLRDLIVASELRAQGVGSRLLAAFESLAAERDATRLALRTYRDEPAYGFYRHRGWVDEASWDWKHGREFVQMRRDL